MLTLLQKKYKKEVVPEIKKRFGYKNDLAVPRIEKVVINIGAGAALKDSKLLEVMKNTLKEITGQLPVQTKARKSVSGFNVRQGMFVGIVATLRGFRMYEFLNKLINVVLPRVRDFRGLSRKAFDGQGNYSLGLKEHTVFPEIKAEEVEKIHGLEINVVTSAENNKEGEALLELLGFPFERE